MKVVTKNFASRLSYFLLFSPLHIRSPMQLDCLKNLALSCDLACSYVKLGFISDFKEASN